MSTVTMSRQTSLSGRDLQNAVQAMVGQMAGMNPYRMLGVDRNWEGGSRLVLRAGNHMTGAITLQSGNPSTVTAQINLLSGLAQGQRSRVEQDMAALAAQHLGGAAAAQAPAATATGQQLQFRPNPYTTTPSTTTPSTTPSTTPPAPERRPFNWGGFGTVFAGLFSGVSEGLDNLSNSYADEAVAVAHGEAVKQGVAADAPGAATGKQIDTSPVSPEDETPWQQFTEMITGSASETPATGAPGAPPGQQTPPQASGMPTWGWVAIGVGGVAMLGLLLWAVSGDGEDEEDERRRRDRDDRDDRDDRRSGRWRDRFDDDDDIRENYGFRYFL